MTAAPLRGSQRTARPAPICDIASALRAPSLKAPTARHTGGAQQALKGWSEWSSERGGSRSAAAAAPAATRSAAGVPARIQVCLLCLHSADRPRASGCWARSPAPAPRDARSGQWKRSACRLLGTLNSDEPMDAPGGGPRPSFAPRVAGAGFRDSAWAQAVFPRLLSQQAQPLLLLG